MGYPVNHLLAPPPPTYPQYPELVARARAATPRFVDPADLYPHRPVMDRRGDDWCTAVLGRPVTVWDADRLPVGDAYLLIEADRMGLDPPLPEWIVSARAESAAARHLLAERQAAARRADLDRWRAARAAADVDVVVHTGTHNRARGGGSQYEPIGHVVPRVAVYSGGVRTPRPGRNPPPREHPPGRALCESPNRLAPLRINPTPAGEDTPATCLRCLDWMTKVRATPVRRHPRPGSARTP